MKSASIEIIDSISPHPNADNLSIASVLGWKVCVKKDEFVPGEKCVYIFTDSILDERPEYEFLRNKQFRIRTMKLRGQVSEGICFKLNTFNLDPDILVGTDIGEKIGAKHYEKPIPAQLAGVVKGSLPSFLKRTDEENIRNHPEIISEFKDKLCYITKKYDGSSATFYLNGETFGVCSRNLDLKEEGSNSFWLMARKFKIEEALRNFRSLYPGDYACQGELIGPGVNGNHLRMTELSLRIFNLYSITKKKFAHYETVMEFCLDNNIPIVETVWAGKFNFTLEELLDMADKTEYSDGVPCEGLVLRPIQEQESQILNDRLSVKIISQKYSLKHGE